MATGLIKSGLGKYTGLKKTELTEAEKQSTIGKKDGGYAFYHNALLT